MTMEMFLQAGGKGSKKVTEGKDEGGRRMLCRHWARGKCNLAEKCGFAHPPEGKAEEPAAEGEASAGDK